MSEKAMPSGWTLLNPTGKSHMITDTTFFTNEPGYTLLDRFKKTLTYVQCFDVLVGLDDDKIKTF
jgi:hypothetical protein